MTMNEGRDLLQIDAAQVREILVRAIRQTGEAITGHTPARWVVNLSGGLDSAVVCYLAAEAVEPEHVRALLLPYQTSVASSIADALCVVEALGIEHRHYDITAAVAGLYAAKGEDVAQADRHARGNVMARMRMIFGYEECERWGGLLLGTSNKTEALLGYTTIWGDSASAMNLIADLYKTQVRQLARHLGVPAAILDKAPSADLQPGQTDETDLGHTYFALDQVLVRFIDHLMHPDDIVADLQAAMPGAADWPGCVQKLCGLATETTMRPGLVDVMEYKRRLTPLVPQVSRATIELAYCPPKQWGR